MPASQVRNFRADLSLYKPGEAAIRLLDWSHLAKFQESLRVFVRLLTHKVTACHLGFGPETDHLFEMRQYPFHPIGQS